MSNREDVPYKVGFGMPPKETRFKPGQSGNPHGRPKGTLNLATAVRKASRERITVIVNGKPRQVSKLEAAITQMVNRAVKGDPRATQQLLQLAPLLDGDAAVPQGVDDTDRLVMAGIVKRIRQSGPGSDSDP